MTPEPNEVALLEEALAEANKSYETAAKFLAFMDAKVAGLVDTWEEFVLLLDGPVKNAQEALVQDIMDQTGATFDQVIAIGELVKKYGKNEKKIFYWVNSSIGFNDIPIYFCIGKTRYIT